MAEEWIKSRGIWISTETLPGQFMNNINQSSVNQDIVQIQNTGSNSQTPNTQGHKQIIRSPSESTVYAPALQPNMGNEVLVVDQISQFVENMRIQGSQGHGRSPVATQSQAPVQMESGLIAGSTHDDLVIPGPSTAATPQHPQAGSSRRNLERSFNTPQQSPADLIAEHQAHNLAAANGVTDKPLVETEKYKAALVAPKGIVPIDDNIRVLRNFDNDDDFFYVTCHIE